MLYVRESGAEHHQEYSNEKKEVRNQCPQRIQDNTRTLERSQLAMSAYSFSSYLQGPLFLGGYVGINQEFSFQDALCFPRALTLQLIHTTPCLLLPLAQVCKAFLGKD